MTAEITENTALETAKFNYIPALIQMPQTSNANEMRELVEEFRQTAIEIKAEAARIESALKNKRLSYSEAEAAEVLGMKTVTLERLRRDGKISYTRIAGKARYTREFLENFLTANQQLCNRDKKTK